MIESQNYAIIASGTKKRKKLNVPKTSGNFTITSTLLFLAKQISELNPAAKHKPNKDGSQYILLSSIHLDPNNKAGQKKRLEFYKFDVAEDTNYIFVASVITKAVKDKIIKAYNKLVVNYSDSKTPEEIRNILAHTPVLITGNYDDVDNLTESTSKGNMSLFLRYVQIAIYGQQNFIFASFEPDMSHGYLDEKRNFVELDLKKKEKAPQGKEQFNIYRLSDDGGNDGSLSGYTTLRYLYDFGSPNPKIRNLRTITTQDDKSFTQVTIGRFKWSKLPLKSKLIFPDEVFKTFEEKKIEDVDIRYTFTKQDFDEDGNPKKGGILEQVQTIKSQDKLIGFTGSLSLDFDGSSHITLWHSEKHRANYATIYIHRPTFFTIANIAK